MERIEDKLKDANAQKLPEKLSAYCEICKEDRIFIYIGTQLGCKGSENIPLYNCTGDSCKGTKAYQSLIKRFNGRVIE